MNPSFAMNGNSYLVTKYAQLPNTFNLYIFHSFLKIFLNISNKVHNFMNFHWKKNGNLKQLFINVCVILKRYRNKHESFDSLVSRVSINQAWQNIKRKINLSTDEKSFKQSCGSGSGRIWSEPDLVFVKARTRFKSELPMVLQ